MIDIWVSSEGRHTVDAYRTRRGREIADRVAIRQYDEAKPALPVHGGAQIFAALDECTPAERALAGAIWDAHAGTAPASARLNDPRRVLDRFALLSALHADGLNGFRVYAADAVEAVDRYPVFVRLRNGHTGALTGLLDRRQALAAALRALRARGERLRDLMIVEFCDTAGADGHVRKYAAFKVGPAIIPCHLFVSRSWCVKSADDRPDEAAILEARAYFDANPHRDWVKRVFAAAHIDYGRIDYGVRDGVPQAWEINTNPTLGHGAGTSKRAPLPEPLRGMREQDREAVHARLRAALLGLDGAGEDTVHTVALDPRLVAGVRRERAARTRRGRRLEWLRRLYHHPRLGVPLRTAYGRLLPRR